MINHLAEASDISHRVDFLFFVLLALTGLVAIGIAFTILLFSIRYRRGSNADRSHAPANNRFVEFTWTFVPLALFIAIYLWGAVVYADFYSGPVNAMPVFVVGKQWMWKLQHENGRREINELHVPLGQPVRLVLTTEDVIHSFFVPAFRIKQDAVPGRYTSVWFTPTQLGEFHLHCAEYCGADHSRMGGRVVVMTPADFQNWLTQGNAGSSMIARGSALFRKYGCSGCHDARSTVHAPDLNGIFGRIVHLQDGRSVTTDEAYLRDSILLPKKDVVAGFEPIMPSFQGQLGEEDLLDLIAYLKSTSVKPTGDNQK